jgi:hypothetical protein
VALGCWILNHDRSISSVAADEHKDYHASRVCTGGGMAVFESDWALIANVSTTLCKKGRYVKRIGVR